jgi:hypothetical protein
MINNGNSTEQLSGLGLVVPRLGNLQLGFYLIRRLTSEGNKSRKTKKRK